MTPELDYLANRYREAWLTARRLPTGIRLGHGSGWPEMVYDQREQVRRAEREVLFVRPTADQEDQLVECINWLTPLTVTQRQLVWMRAARLSWREMARLTGISRSTVQRHWHKSLLTIQLHQNMKEDSHKLPLSSYRFG